MDKQNKQKQPQKKGGKPAEKGGQQQKKQQKAPKSDAAEDVKREQKLQAILLADSFSKSFRPISCEIPKVLLPLVNVPMIEYTMEFLAQNGVEEIFIFCVWHAEQLQAYINKSKWPSILSVRCISSAACLSAGDALRELDAMNIIRSDPFILISGDVVSNINLKEAIAFHARKRREDINNVMTVVLKKVQKTAGAKRLLDDLVVAVDRTSSQIVLFENSTKKKAVNVSLELLQEHPRGLTFHTDLLDCNVDICSPELIVQFSDNFDYQDIRRDFIQNEVSNWSLGKNIYGYLIQHEYAARVQDFRSYHSICRDIVTRWVYPLVPDAQLVAGSTYVHTKQYAYRESGVRVARSATVGEAVVLSTGTVVGDNVLLRRTIVGRDCTIGADCCIHDCHIWKGVILGEGVTLHQSILCDGVAVGAGAVISRGCILSYGVRIGAGVHLPEFTRMSKYQPEAGRGRLLGGDSEGYIWTAEAPDGADDSSDSDSDEGEEERGPPPVPAGYDPFKMCSIGWKEGEEWKRRLWNRMPPPAESDSDDEDEPTFPIDLDVVSAKACLDFAHVVGDMVSTGHCEGHPAASLLMEIKGYKFAQNKSYCDCLRGIVPAVVEIALAEGGPPSCFKPALVVAKFKSLVKEGGWGHELITCMIQDQTEQVGLVTGLQESCLGGGGGENPLYPLFRFMLQVLHDAEVVSDDAVLQWASNLEELEEDLAEGSGVGGMGGGMGGGGMEGGSDAERVKLFREPQVQAFVEWVREGEEESEEGEEESGEEEEEGSEEDISADR
ncbi:nucleotide-diphospho-sugar transferase [Ochromonadaceae sp. CCMP2298]|nr:nucleotide-diphospho-sugar transferase [Ochromonadaceae sp. CCMP2298]